ncbi:MAG TPA: LysE family translocator [Candidatus Limnocylindria bacterium]|jgi:threonine/homoserine/homoserine lactone efflux protein|nr:LysE family translocator [Candidatus Limnocylindria bacterium]
MNLFQSVVGVLGVLVLGAMSPGPSFVFVARTSVAGSRGQGMAAALGMGVGGILFAALVIGGLQAFLVGVPWLYLILKGLGGLYLVCLAVGVFRGAKQPLDEATSTAVVTKSCWCAFRRGLFTQLSNPKTAVVYGSIFAALLPRDLPRYLTIILPLFVFLIEAGWYSIVALVLSSSAPRSIYLKSKTTIDRVAGGVLGLLGIKLLASAHES